MIENRINEIIARALNGSANLLDYEELKQWRSESGSNEIIFNTIKKYWESKNPRESRETEKIRIQKLMNYAENSLVSKNALHSGHSPFFSIFRYAAMIAVILGLGFAAGYILPGFFSQAKISEVTVSRGSRANVTLPDGSIVWLGHDSRISYPEKFSGKLREVNLTGEAFFDVESDKDHPFLVHTSGPTIRVTGTEFYVHDYPGEPVMETSLVTGKIDLVINNRSLYKMQAGTKLVYLKETGKITGAVFEPGYYEYWKKGEYSFVDQSFTELASMMKRIYNVEIVFRSPELKTKRFTGSLGSDDNIYTLLEVFKKSSSTSFEYSIDNNKIYVKMKK